MTALVVLRVKEPTQASRFYGDVLGFDVVVFDDARVRVDLPGVALELIREERAASDALFGPGASRHRPGVGVELRLVVANPAALAERVRTRGGFLVSETPTSVTVRDGDGYVATFATTVD
jgi:catechol 2,3-dioxygenase-like lactoylglutathione lyase family enzyme